MKISTDENLPIYGNAQQQSTVGSLRESNSSYKTGISQLSVAVMKHPHHKISLIPRFFSPMQPGYEGNHKTHILHKIFIQIPYLHVSLLFFLLEHYYFLQLGHSQP